MSLQRGKVTRLGLPILILLVAGAAALSFRQGLLDLLPGGSRAGEPATVVHKQPPPSPMALVLHTLSGQKSFSVVQIGAYIGDTDSDPLFDFLSSHLAVEQAPEGTQVVLVEPIREYFDQLTENYAGLTGIEFENVAIAETAGECEMFRLDVDPTEYGYPEWLAQLNSLKKERMEELWEAYERNPKLQQFYLEHRIVEKVQCMTLQQLFDKHQISELDLLQIDAEGFDFEILKTLDFSKTRPRFINYERVLLQEAEPACRQLLSSNGYQLVNWGQSTMSVRDDQWQAYQTQLQEYRQ